MGGCIGPEMREYFTLGGCYGPESIILAIFREYFTLGGCHGPAMSNAISAVVVTPLSLELATWLGGRGVSY